MSSHASRRAALILSYCRGIAPRQLVRLRTAFGSSENIVAARPSEWIRAGLSAQTAQELRQLRDTLDADATEASLASGGVAFVEENDERFPEILRMIPDPPAGLFCRGNLSCFHQPGIAIVGTRRPTTYGRQALQTVLAQFPFRDAVTVSGFAAGIDGMAHEMTVRGGGRTIAVFGSGVDDRSWYPAVNRSLGRSILSGDGLLVSEYPPGTHPRKEYFPYRNRIIAGLSRAVLVVEAKERSGALITARLALDTGRDVLAIPGPITAETSDGPNRLIQLGATPIRAASDLCAVLGVAPADVYDTSGLADDERSIVESCRRSPHSIDELVEHTGLETRNVIGIVSRLELRHILIATGDGQYHLHQNPA